MAVPHATRVLLPHADPLLALASILFAGVLAGNQARRAGVPRVTGQILVGILIGPSVFALFDDEPLHLLEPITEFALALMTMTVGSHLYLRRMRAAGRRLFTLALFEAFLPPLLILSVLHLVFGIPAELALLLGVLSVSTAPATVVALVKETRSKGVFVNTLLSAVALNNIACITLYVVATGIARGALNQGVEISLGSLLLRALLEVLSCAALGSVTAFGLVRATRGVTREDTKATASLVALLATHGLATWLGFSPLLACLFLGMGLVNLAPHHDGLGDRVFMNFEEAILCVFFTMAGMHLDFRYLEVAGGLAVGAVVLRVVGKHLAAWCAMTLAGAPEMVRRHLGLALVPQAGVAIGLLLLTSRDPGMAPVADLLLATGVTMVALNEILGPLLTRSALRASGEAGQDRARLIDFLHEEHIVVDLEARTMEEAIDQLTDLLVRTHPGVDGDAFQASALAREAQDSTCVGEGLAIPHGQLPDGDEIVGVMGLSRRGLRFETPDGEPVHCIVLLATPPKERDRHVETLAALARIVRHPEARENLFHALTPAHAYVTLQAEEFEEFNYFLEEMDHF